MRALHSTLHFDRVYDATPARLFEAFESVEARSRWGVPGDQRLIYEAADFRVGGVDVCRCGDPGALDHRVETRYLDIVPGVASSLPRSPTISTAVSAVRSTRPSFPPIRGARGCS